MLTKQEIFIYELSKNVNVRKGSIYSQIIKGERIRRNKTLEEVSKGICSVSYLSKLENQILIPSREYIFSLLERMDINYDDVEKLDLSESLTSCIEYYLYDKKDYIIDLFESIRSITFNSCYSLIKCFKHLIKEEMEEFKEEIAILDEIKNCLSGEEALTLLFLVNEYYCITFQYSRVLSISKCMEKVEIKNYNLKLMFMEQSFKSAYYLENYPRLWKAYYDCLFMRLPFGYPLKRKTICRMMFTASNCIEYTEQAIADAKGFDKEIEELRKDFDVMYYKYLILTKCGLYYQVFEEIYSNSFYIDIKFLSLMGYCAYMLNRQECIDVFKSIAKKEEFDEYERVHYTFVDFLLCIYGNDRTYDKIMYFRHEILSYDKDHYHPLYSQIYYKFHINVLKKTSRYKEATIFLQQNKINYS